MNNTPVEHTQKQYEIVNAELQKEVERLQMLIKDKNLTIKDLRSYIGKQLSDTRPF